MDKLEVTRSSLPPFEEYCQEIKSLWDSHFITNMGEKHEALRTRLEAFFGCPAALFSNGHLALEAALSLLDLPRGAEVITTPFTFVSTVNAIVRRGLVPVFADVCPDDGCLDPASVERLISERTGAILPVHVYGNVCDIEAFTALSGRYGLPVLYDAAHCFGVRWQGVPVPALGTLSIVSFHATKVFTTIEGGAVCFHDPAFRQRLDDEKNFGIRDTEHCAAPGGNAKLNEFQAAMGLCNLRHFAEEQALRRQVFEWYLEALPADVTGGAVDQVQQGLGPGPGTLAGARLLRPRAGVEPNYAYFPLVFASQTLRDQAFTALEAAGVHPRKYFYPLCSDFPHLAPYRRSSPMAGTPPAFTGATSPSAFTWGASPSAFTWGASAIDTPVAARLASCVLCLPLHPAMTESDVGLICHTLRKNA